MRRSIVIVALVMALVASYIFFIMPLSAKRSEIKDSLQAKYATLHKYEAYLRTSEKTETELDTAVKKIEDMETHVLQDTEESLAFVNLQGYVQGLAEKSGIKIISIKPLPVVKYKHYSGLPIQLEAGGVISHLGEFMRQIDESKRFFRIDRLNINVTNVQMPSELKIRMQISGLIKI